MSKKIRLDSLSGYQDLFYTDQPAGNEGSDNEGFAG
jgi:hypothetical protein